MRAGKLDSVIAIQRYTVIGDDGYGNQIVDWADLATLRAQPIKASTEEFIRTYGITEEGLVVFRTRYLDGVTTADRVVHDGFLHDIKEVKEIGRGKGLEIRTVARGEAA